VKTLRTTKQTILSGVLSLIILYLCIVWNKSEFEEITLAP